jgi:hypothetical protein
VALFAGREMLEYVIMQTGDLMVKVMGILQVLLGAR